jgi:hypothetical protein
VEPERSFPYSEQPHALIGWARWTQLTLSHLKLLISILILSFNVRIYLLRGFSSSGFATKMLYAFHMSLMNSTFIADLIILYLTILIFVEYYKLWSRCGWWCCIVSGKVVSAIDCFEGFIFRAFVFAFALVWPPKQSVAERFDPVCYRREEAELGFTVAVCGASWQQSYMRWRAFRLNYCKLRRKVSLTVSYIPSAIK